MTLSKIRTVKRLLLLTGLELVSAHPFHCLIVCNFPHLQVPACLFVIRLPKCLPYAQDLELSTVALAVVHFERLVLKVGRLLLSRHRPACQPQHHNTHDHFFVFTEPR